jgi:hypothetical protein
MYIIVQNIDLHVYKLKNSAQSQLSRVILLIVWMLKYNKQCCEIEVQDYLVVYPQLNESNPFKQMVNKPEIRLDILIFVNKLSATQQNLNMGVGTSPNMAPPVSTTQIVNNSTFSGGAASGTPDESGNLVVKGEVQQMDTTVFVDNAETAQRDESQVSHVDPRWFTINDTQTTEQSIKDYLAKPIVLLSGNLTIADTLTSISAREMPFSAWSNLIWTEKLRGYYGIRMDMRFRLVVNANRFQQGRYMLGWVPLGGMGPSVNNTKSVLFRQMHMATLVQRTTIPHAELDIATTTSCEILVPFASVHTFYPLNAMTLPGGSFNSTLGYVCLYPYSPLVSPAGSTVASFTLYCSFENVTLFGAASPQSLATEREISHKLNGPISGVAAAFSRGFTEISNIPLLSSYAKGAAWISDRIAKTAKVFGFVKPTQGDSMSKMMILNNPGHSNVDGDSEARTLSYLAKPAVVAIDGHSGTDYDEMDFSYVARKFAWYDTFTWTTSSSGTLYTFDVQPHLLKIIGGAAHYLPVGFVTSFFEQWRGSIKVRLKFVKTEFHSGRLMVCFFPTDEIASNQTSPEYVNRHIIDIREYNEFTFEIPYISRYAWSTAGTRTGVLSIRVVDALVAPATVSSTVTILAEVAAGDDMQWSIASAVTSMQPTQFVPQSLGNPNKISINIGNTQTMGDSITPSAFTIGDQITSFRSMLKRYYPVVPSSRALVNTSTRANGLILDVYHDLIPIRALVPAADSVTCDIVGAVASCYTFWGGGIRIKDVLATGLVGDPASIFTSNMSTVSFVPKFNGAEQDFWFNLNPPSTIALKNVHQIIQNVWENGTLVTEIPQYTRTLKRCIPDAWFWRPNVADPDSVSYRDNLTQGYVRIATPAGLGAVPALADYDYHNIYRSLADDGEFSLFISIPPMVNASTSGYYPLY